MGNKAFSKKILICITGVFLTLVLLSGSGCSSLKINASVAGTVYQYNRPMPNFQVQLVDESGHVIATEPTNSQGHFIISDVPTGEYKVYVLTFAGTPYKGYEGHIKVRLGRMEKFDIDLGGDDVPQPKL